MRPAIPKKQLLEIIDRFLSDPNRGISVELFAELAGVGVQTLKLVFQQKKAPLSEYVQRRVSKAYEEWRDGHVRVMRNRNRVIFSEYRKEPKMFLKRDMRLSLENGRIVVKTGVVNRFDYDRPTLAQQFKR